MKKSAKRTVRASDRAAKDFVSELGGRKTRASGSGLEKGDGRVWGKFRTETKCPPTGRFRLTVSEWEKIWLAAISGGEVALMHLKLHDVELVVLRQQDFTGFGGVIDPQAFELGTAVGHAFSKKIWMKALGWSQQIIFALKSTYGETPARQLIAINRTSFVKLVEGT